MPAAPWAWPNCAVTNTLCTATGRYDANPTFWRCTKRNWAALGLPCFVLYALLLHGRGADRQELQQHAAGRPACPEHAGRQKVLLPTRVYPPANGQADARPGTEAVEQAADAEP